MAGLRASYFGMTGRAPVGGHGKASRDSAISCRGACLSPALSGQTTVKEARGIAILAAGVPKKAATPKSTLSSQAVRRSLTYGKYDTWIA